MLVENSRQYKQSKGLNGRKNVILLEKIVRMKGEEDQVQQPGQRNGRERLAYLSRVFER